MIQNLDPVINLTYFLEAFTFIRIPYKETEKRYRCNIFDPKRVICREVTLHEKWLLIKQNSLKFTL